MSLSIAIVFKHMSNDREGTPEHLSETEDAAQHNTKPTFLHQRQCLS